MSFHPIEMSDLRQRFEAIRIAEVDRVSGRLGELTVEQKNAIESLSRGIVNNFQLLEIPTIFAVHDSAAPEREHNRSLRAPRDDRT